MTKYGSFKERKSVNITYHTDKPNTKAYQHSWKNASQDSRPSHYSLKTHKLEINFPNMIESTNLQQ